MAHRQNLSRWMLAVMAMMLAIIIAGCRAAAAEPTDQQTGEVHREPASGGETTVVEQAAESTGERTDSSGGPPAAATAAPAEAPAAGGEAGPAYEEADRGGGAGPESVAPLPTAVGPQVVPPDQQYQSPLQAGETDDNEDFQAYLQYRLDFQRFLGYQVYDLDVSERHIIRVTTANGLPVLGATVMIYDGQNLVTALRTTSSGQAYFFPLAYPARAGAQSYNVTVQKDQASQTFTLTRDSRDAVWPVTLNVQPTRPPVQLDVLFLVDATGSMGDEIEQLKDNILSISAQIEALPSNPDVRFGLVYYRDRGDEFVTRRADFTGNVQEFQSYLMNVWAAGGGDDPESLNEALHEAIWNVSWRVDNTVSLIFLVADAPPHLDYPQDYSYATEMQNAAQMGIKIYPIASRLDGADYFQQQAEYIFRQLAQYTGGHFIFLTYADTPQTSGEPGTEAHVQEGSYTVEDLDTLVVRLVEAELAQLSGGQ